MTPVEGVEISLREQGNTARTNTQGLFRLFLADPFTQGDKITLDIKKEDWRIQYPLDGEVVIPAEFDKKVIPLRLLPVGSKKFWSADRIEKFIADTVERAKEQVRLEGKPEEVNFGRYIKEWATQYGFSAEEAKAEIDKWVAEVQKRQDDPHKSGLAAYAEKKFGRASSLFMASAEDHIQQLEAVERQKEALIEKTVRDLRLAGDAAYSNYTFDQALIAYQRALNYISRKTHPRLWAAVSAEIGLSHSAMGIRTAGTIVHEHLNAAVNAYRLALEVYTREQLPQQWARTQNNLGAALQAQGIRTGGEEGRALLAQAVDAYRLALEVRTREQLPQDWATTQNNLGLALSQLGKYDHNAEMLREAEIAVQAAYAFYTDAGYTHYAEYFENKLSEIRQLIKELK
jgi:tetratricopeptide (TPR) repeat protein